MSKDERKLKAKVNEYFEKYMCVSFDKFIENWEETSEALEYKDKENKRLNNIINELEKDIDRQITFCTNEADATTNDKYCRIAINYLKHLKDKIKELKGSDK